MLSVNVFVVALISFLIGLASLFFHEKLFSDVRDVSSFVLDTRPIILHKRLLTPSSCNLSINGWSEGSEDFAANEYLKINSIGILIHSSESTKPIAIKNEHMNIINFETESSGHLEIDIREYEPSPLGLKLFDAELQCKSGISRASVFVGIVFILLGLFIVAFQLARVAWKKLIT